MNRKPTLYITHPDKIKEAIHNVEGTFGKLGTFMSQFDFRLSLGQMEKRKRGEVEWGLDELMVLERLAHMLPGTLYTLTLSTDSNNELKGEEG